jgi:hypothetical protein
LISNFSFDEFVSMGVDYHYANLTKREWFAADTFGENSKQSGLGCGLSARAFQLLLLRRELASVSKFDVGRWSTDSVTLIGDNHKEFEKYEEDFADVSADVIVMVYAFDGFEEIAEAAGKSKNLFMELCHLVVTHQKQSLERHLIQHFGANYRQHYSELCKQRPFMPRNLAFL